MAQLDDDVADFVAERRLRSQTNVIDSIDADKDKAAKSLDLSQSTGADPNMIYGNFDDFSRDHKTSMVNSLVDRDRLLDNYIQSNSLAAKVSRDDWGNLARFTEILGRAVPGAAPVSQLLRSKSLWDVLGETWKSVSEPWKEPLGAPAEEIEKLQKAVPWLMSEEEWDKTKETRKLPGWIPGGLDPLMYYKLYDVTSRVFESAFTGAAVGARETYIKAGGDEAWANRLARDIYGGGQALLMFLGTGAHVPVEYQQIAKAVKQPGALEALQELNRLKELAEKTGPFIRSGEQPPKGMDLAVDHAIAGGAKQELEEAKEQQKRAAATETKELSPELFERLVEQATKQDIEVSWDGVKALYGDKLPEPGDKILGDVPNIQEQWKRSEVTGEPITMTKAHWLAKIDSEIWKALKDDYRDRPNSMSANEIKSLEEPTVQQTRLTEPRDLVGNIRAAAGLDPLFKEEKIGEPRKPSEMVEAPEEKELIKPGAIVSKRIHEAYKRVRERILNRDEARQLEIERRKAKKEMTPEWTENKNKMRDEVTEDIDQRPDFKLNNFLQYGKIDGEDIGKLKINPESLWPYQKEAVPKNFLSADGVTPDQLAKVFGFQTGYDAMEALTQFYNEKGELGAKAWKNRVIEEETNRRMEQRYGKFEENVLNEAREHVVNPDQFSQIHDEVRRLADMLGQKMPLTKEDFRAQAFERFNTSTASKADLARILREVGRAGKEAEAAFLKGDIDGAYKSRQQQAHLFAEAEFIKQFQRKIWKPLDAIAKRYNKAEVPTMPQEFLNHIQNLLARIGCPSKRGTGAITEAMSHQEHQSLETFAEARNQRHLPEGYEEYEVDYNPTIIVPDFVLDPAWNKTLDNMTVGEARAVHGALSSLVKQGRGENKIFLEGRELDRREALDEAKGQLEKLGEVKANYNFNTLDKVRDKFWRMHAGLMQIESLFARWDLDNPRGFFTQNIFKPIMDAAKDHDKLRRDFSKRILDLDKHKPEKGLNEAIPNKTFYNPIFVEKDAEGKFAIPPAGTHWLSLNRDNLRAVLLNVGNASNLDILARGFLTTPEKIMQWVHEHATEKDWAWAQDVGKIFEDLQKRSDKMTMGMTGSVIEKIPLGKIQTKFGAKDGWYYPVIYDRTGGGGPMGTIEPAPLVRIMTDRGFERKRTGYAGPIDLHTDQLTNQIDRRLRDLALRPVLGEVSKLALDKEFQTAIKRHYGEIYAGMMEPWLRNLVSQNGYTTKTAQAAANMGEYIRSNVIGTLIGWNPGTLIKHTISSFVQSAWEVSSKEFSKAVRDLYGSNTTHAQSWNKFIMEGGKIGELDWGGSTEVQRRMQHWEETLGGAYESQLGKRGLRAKMLEKGAMPIGRVDQWISKVTWLAKYRQEFAKSIRKLNESGERSMTDEEAHMDAVDLADRAVRRTHGTTSMAGKPEFMRTQNPITRSLVSLYGFFNHIFNRYYQMGWKAKQIPEQFKRGEPVAGDIAKLGADFLFYVAAPVAIEEWMDQTCKPTDGWGVCTSKWLVNGITAPVPIIREIAHAALTGHDPSFGIFQSGYKAVTDIVKDMSPAKWDKHHAGQIVEHINTLAGVATGLSSKQLGRWQKYAINYALHEDRAPKSMAELGRVIRWGSTQEPKHR